MNGRNLAKHLTILKSSAHILAIHIETVRFMKNGQENVFGYFQLNANVPLHLNRVLAATSTAVLTRIPSQRDTARSGRKARNVRIERNAGISAAPAQIAPKFINDN